MNISTIIISRDEHVGSLLHATSTLTEHRVVVALSSSSTTDLLSVIRSHNPDLVILDPEIDQGATLALWRSYVGVIPVLVCASTSDRYAVDAFAAGAVHYVMLDQVDATLAEAVRRAAVRLLRYDRGGPNGTPAREWQAPFTPKVVALPHATGIEIRTREEVVSAHGEGNYTRIVLAEDPPMLMSRPIGEYEVTLSDAGLVRVHRSHMVNVDHIRRVRRGKSPIIELSNGAEVDVSESYRDTLFRFLQIHGSRRHDRD